MQYAKQDLTKRLNEKQKKQIQKVTGKFLYNARSVYCIVMHAVNELNIAASDPTEETQKDLENFLDYVAIHPETQNIY